MNRTGKENLTQAYLCPLYFVTLGIRQPFISPPFPTILIFWDWRGMATGSPLATPLAVNDDIGKIGYCQVS